MRREEIIICFRVVNSLLHADGKLTDEEKRFLKTAMDNMAFTPEERVVATTFMTGDQTEAAVRSLSPAMRKGLFEALIEGSLADRHLDDEERSFIKRVGTTMEFDDTEMDAMWERMLRLVLSEHKVDKGYYG